AALEIAAPSELAPALDPSEVARPRRTRAEARCHEANRQPTSAHRRRRVTRNFARGRPFRVGTRRHLLPVVPSGEGARSSEAIVRYAGSGLGARGSAEAD